MKRRFLLLSGLAILIFASVSAQDNRDYSKIDIMLGRGEFKRVIDTCKLILA